MNRKIIWVWAFIFFSFTHGSPLPPNYEFIRTTKTHMQSRGWVLYSPSYPALVILVGIVHMGEKDYYRNILDLLDSCDMVFYEDIQPKSFFEKFQSSSGFPSLGLVSMDTDLGVTTGLQMQYARALDLEYQGNWIQPKRNWVNADISWEDFQDLLQAYREENLSIDKKSIDGDITEIKDILRDKEKDPKKVMEYRRIIAQETTDQAQKFYTEDEYKQVFDLFVGKRNEVAMKKISPSLSQDKIIGMVYGAAHAPDLIQQLEDRFDYRIINHTWINAWSFK